MRKIFYAIYLAVFLMAAQGNPISYRLSIDWANAGSFPDNGDSARLSSFRIDRGRESTLMGDAFSNTAKLARNKVGQLILRLDNEDRRYDAFNISSPLYPNVAPGKIVQLKVTDDYGATRTLLTGIIDNIQSFAYGTTPAIQITCSDAWKTLSQRPLSTALYSPGNTYSVMTEILRNAGVNLGVTHLGSDTLYIIWGDEDVPHKVLHDLTELDGGYCWIDVDNQFNNLSRVAAQAQTPVFTLAQSQCLKDIGVSQPWENLKNEIHVALYDRTHPPYAQIVWSTPDRPLMQPGDELTYVMSFQGVNGAACPVGIGYGEAIAYSLNSKLDGTGTNLGAYLQVTYADPPGGAVRLQVTFKNIGSQAGYLLSLSYTALPYDALNPSEAVVRDLPSIGNYGVRALTLDYQYMQWINVAKQVGNYYLQRFKEPRATFAVQIKNRSDIQFAHDLNALINFTSSYLATSNFQPIVKAPTIAASISNYAVGDMSENIPDPGFESGAFGSWINSDADTGLPNQWAVVSGGAHSGSYSAKAVIPTGDVNSHSIQQRYFTCLPSASYEYDFWYNVTAHTGAQREFQVMLNFYDSSMALISSAFLLQTTSTTSGWTLKQGAFVTPAGAAFIQLIVGVDIGSTSSITVQVDDFLFPGLGNVWNSPALALSQNGQGAYALVWKEAASPASESFTDVLRLTNLGYSFQPTDIIRGIGVRIRRKSVAPPASPGYTAGAKDEKIKLVIAGVISGNNKAKSTVWGANFADAFYGGPSDLWGLTPVYSDMNAPTTGIAISARASLLNASRGWATAYIDYAEMTVYTNNGAFTHAFRIVGVKHETGVTTKEVTTTWVLEPAVNSSGLLSPDQIISSPVAGEQFPILGGITY